MCRCAIKKLLSLSLTPLNNAKHHCRTELNNCVCVGDASTMLAAVINNTDVWARPSSLETDAIKLKIQHTVWSGLNRGRITFR